MDIAELYHFDQQYLQLDNWPVNEFHHWETTHFLPLSIQSKLAVLEHFNPRSTAFILWQNLHLLLLDSKDFDAERFTALFRNLPVLQQNMLYSQLMRANFIGKLSGFDYAPLYKILIENFCRQSAQLGSVNALQGVGNEQVVLLLTNQFVTAQHGPTLTVLNYASVLKVMGKHPVVICCTAVAKSAHYVYPVPAPIFFGTVRNEYFSADKVFDLDDGSVTVSNSGSMVKCWGQLFDFMQISPLDDSDHLLDLITVINQINPRFILAVGGLNPVMEFIAQQRPVLNVPCVTSLVTPLYAVPVLHRPLTETDQRRLDQLGVRHPVLCSKLPFRLRQFNCSKVSAVTDKVIKFAIVGYRLEHEIKDDFIATLRAIRQRLPQSAFVMIGPDSIASLPQDIMRCTYFSGKVSNAIELIANCHFMLNPKRQGGGTSAIEALSLGIPVFTEAYGDVYQYIGDDFVFCSDEQRLDFIQHYLNDAAFREANQQTCLQVAAAATDSSMIVQSLLLDYDSYIFQLQS